MQVVEVAQAGDIDVVAKMADVGLLSMMFSCLKAYEMLGRNST
jgi:hypothetical protein